jgi:hypothetical protein
MKTILSLYIILFSLVLKAQTPPDSTRIYTAITANKFVPVYHRPLLKDKTLLFFKNSIICECSYINQIYDTPIPSFKTDFKRVKKCLFKEKIFVETKNSLFEKPHYKFKSEKIVGELVLIKKNIFEYKEFNTEEKVVRAEKFEFKFDSVTKNVQFITFDQCFNEIEEKHIYFEVQKLE